jgi:drug/metabolite transporter (DMT)-like permease
VAGWLLFAERLGAIDLLAIALTLGGVAWVVAERRPAGTNAAAAASQTQATAAGRDSNRNFGLGVVLGAGAATCQALGLITSRLGMHDNFPVISATVMRMLTACAAVWVVALILGQARRPFMSLRNDGRSALAIALAACIGPVSGVTLSLIAIQNAPVGIASTLMALTPVIVLPLVRVLHNERISPRALVGTVVALAGVALIFMG